MLFLLMICQFKNKGCGGKIKTTPNVKNVKKKKKKE
jgi:hypothetical protein